MVKDGLGKDSKLGSAGVDGGGCGPGGVSERMGIDAGLISDTGLKELEDVARECLWLSYPEGLAGVPPIEACLWLLLSLCRLGTLGRLTGRFAKASKKGAGLSAPPSVESLGVTERIPTMITGTIREREPSPDSPLPFPSLLFVLPKRNIRKKFNGAISVLSAWLASGGAPPPSSFPPFLRAAARRPFCNARRKDSKLPSPPLSPATS